MLKKQDKGKIIIISGSSGVGKYTILKQLFNNQKLNLVYSTSITTRLAREGEIEGKDYYFVSKIKFNQLILKNEFIEFNEYCNNFYGTPRKYVEEQLLNGKNVILEIEVHGSKNVIKYLKETGIPYLSIFIDFPSFEELKSRLLKRHSESPDVIEERICEAKKEIIEKEHYQYIVLNDVVDNAVNKITKIINNEK